MRTQNIFKDFTALVKKAMKKQLFISHIDENYYISDGCWIFKTNEYLYNSELMPVLFYEVTKGENITIKNGRREEDHKAAEWLKKAYDSISGKLTAPGRLTGLYVAGAEKKDLFGVVATDQNLISLNKTFLDAVPAVCDNITCGGKFEPVLFSDHCHDTEFCILPVNIDAKNIIQKLA